MSDHLEFLDSKGFKKRLKSSEDTPKNVGVRKQFVAEEIKQTDEDSREVRFVISTNAVDRDKDTLNPKGFELENFQKNPSVLFAHQSSRPPIGRANEIGVQGSKLKATAEFMDNDIDTSGFSDMIFRMVKGGFLKATSVGFLPIEFEFPEDEEAEKRPGGIDFLKQELLEFSIVPVPANPEALIEARGKGIDTKPLCEWYDEALSDWAAHKNMLLVPKRHVEQLAKAAEGKTKVFHLSKKEQDELLQQNLDRIRNMPKTENTYTHEEDDESLITLEEFNEDQTEAPVKADAKDFTVTDTKDNSLSAVNKRLREHLEKSPKALPNVAMRVFNTPLCIHEGKLGTLMHVLGPRLGLNMENHSEIFTAEDPDTDFDERDEKTYEVSEDGVATIPVVGTLTADKDFDGNSGMTSYNVIENKFNEALEDDEVRAIAFEFDSPGGEAAGLMELVDTIYEARGKKPMWSIVDCMAYSAAFALATATDKVVVGKSGGVGSVGVVCVHADISAMAHDMGIDFTLLHAGDRKVDGHPFGPLSRESRREIEASIDEHYDLFVNTVARNLALPPEDIKATQARCYMGEKAFEVGFAEEIIAPSKAYQKLVELTLHTTKTSDDDEEEDEDDKRTDDEDEDKSEQFSETEDVALVKMVKELTEKVDSLQSQLNSTKDNVNEEDSKEFEIEIDDGPVPEDNHLEVDKEYVNEVLAEAMQMLPDITSELIQSELRKLKGRLPDKMD